MLNTLPGNAVSGEITGTDLDFRIPLAEIFSESTNTRTKHSKVFFTVYCILTIYVRSRLLDYVYNINFSFILNEKFIFSGFERLVNIVPETINNDNNNNVFNSFDENTYQKLQRWRTSY